MNKQDCFMLSTLYVFGFFLKRSRNLVRDGKAKTKQKKLNHISQYIA